MPLDPIAALQILSTIAESCAAILGIFAMVIVFLIERHREKIKDRERIWERSVATFHENFLHAYMLIGLPGFKELVREIGYEAIEGVLERLKKERAQVPPQIVVAARNLRVEWNELEEVKRREIMPKKLFSLFVALFIVIIGVSIYSMSYIRTGAEDVGWGLEVAIWSIFIGLLVALACLGVLIWFIALKK